jgi:hypothetical protein
MPCKPTHQVIAALSACAIYAHRQDHPGSQPLPHPVAGNGGATAMSCLPDILEPATSPNHRKFFHSVVFAAAVGAGIYRTYQWEPALAEPMPDLTR